MKQHPAASIGLGVCLVSVAFIFTGCDRLARSNTEFATGFTRDKFGRIKLHDDPGRILETLGSPLFVEINRDRKGVGTYQIDRLYDLKSGEIERLASASNSIVYFYYSYMEKSGSPYLSYRVDISDGSVIKIEDGINVLND